MKLFRLRESSGSRRSARVWMLRFRKFGMIAALACLVPGAGFYAWKTGAFARAGDWIGAKTLAVTASAGFTVDEILVTGRIHVSRDELLRRLDVRRGQPVFGVSVEKAQQALSEISWIRSVTVTRRLPDKIIVEVAERAPVALWQYHKKLSVIDREGRTLTSDNLDAFQSLPLVVGEDAPQHAAALLDLLQAEPSVAAEFASAVRIGGRRWDLRLKNGLLVRLPEHEEGLALSRLARHQREGLLTKDISSIDLRLPDEMIVLPAATAKGDNKKTI